MSSNQICIHTTQTFQKRTAAKYTLAIMLIQPVFVVQDGSTLNILLNIHVKIHWRSYIHNAKYKY